MVLLHPCETGSYETVIHGDWIDSLKEEDKEELSSSAVTVEVSAFFLSLDRNPIWVNTQTNKTIRLPKDSHKLIMTGFYMGVMRRKPKHLQSSLGTSVLSVVNQLGLLKPCPYSEKCPCAHETIQEQQ